MASNTIIARETATDTRLSVTNALVGTFGPRVEVVGINYTTNPCEILGASALRAIWSCPLRLSVQACEAIAVHVLLTCAVMRA